jgi:hypothetical protein
LGQKRRAEATSKKARAKESKSEKTADMDRRERHNERHRLYRARRRQQEKERNRELAHLREFYGVMMDVNFEAVAMFEMLTRYRDHPEAFLEETIAVEEILRVLNLQ